MKGGSDCRLRSRTKALRGRGFTIIETLIVLTVSMAMFLSAVILINGKQHTTEFNQSIRTVQNQLQAIMNQVGSGYYQSDSKIGCSVGGNKKPNLTTLSGTKEQGSNNGCVFMGKIIQFGVSGTDPEQYNVYTVVGLQDTGNTDGKFDLNSAAARVIAKGNSEAGSSIPNEYDSNMLGYGLTVDHAYYSTTAGAASGPAIAALGFISNLSDLSGGQGSGSANIVAVENTELHVNTPTGVDQINSNLSGTKGGSYAVDPVGGIHICFRSGGTNQSGLISLGTGDRDNAVTLKIYSNRTCS